MKKENIVRLLVIAVTILIFSGGITFAYFTATTSDDGVGESGSVNTTILPDVKLTTMGLGKSNNAIYPGTKNYIGTSVTATIEGDNPGNKAYTAVYNLTGKITLSEAFGYPVTYKIYEENSMISSPIVCEEVNTVSVGNELRYSQVCNEDTGLSNVIYQNTINPGITEETINVTNLTINTDRTKNYYLVVEYPNVEEGQDVDQGKGISFNLESVTAISMGEKQEFATTYNLSTSTTENSITVNVEVEDESVIDSYFYSIDNGITYVESKESSYTFTDLEISEIRDIKVFAIDANGVESKIFVHKIIKEISSIPSQSGTLTYTGKAQSPSWSNYNTTELTISGTTTGTNAGNYSATFTPKTYYQWSDGSRDAKTVTWSIGKANGSVSTSSASVTIAVGSTSNITVTRSGNGKISASSNATSVATVSVSGKTVTVTGVSAGTATITISVAEGTNHNATSKTVSVTVNPSAKDIILANVSLNTGTPDLSKTSCSSGCMEATVGLYSAEDNDGTSYYFRGNVTNNYVKFAGFYWRIIRINGDGTIRLIYDGKSARANGTSSTDTQIGTSAFNSISNDNAYVGYMYGTPRSSTYNLTHANINSSTIKGVLDDWYKNNLESYASYIDTNAGFCGDRTAYADSKGTIAGSGVWDTDTYYGYHVRNQVAGETLKCTNSSDLYTVSGSSKGNKALTYPIGLITADEVSYAGGLDSKSNQSYYLYTGQYYWTMTPSNFRIDYALMLCVCSDGLLYPHDVAWTDVGVRPVINLKADTQFTGNGSMSTPFEVVLATDSF